MTSIIAEDRAVLRDQILPAIVEMLDDAPTDAAGLEYLAATLLIALDQPELPAEVGAEAVNAIEGRRDRAAAGTLEALGLLGGAPVAALAREAAGRLADAGVIAPAADRLGTLSVDEAVRVDGGGVELLVALLRRPAGRKRQAVVVGIEHADTGGALLECTLTPPMPTREARAMLVPDAAGDDDAPPALPISVEALSERLTAAAQRSVDAGIALGHGAGPAWPILARALTGDPHGLPRPEVLSPVDEDDDPELIVDGEDEERLHAVTARLLNELEEHARSTYPLEGAVWRHGDFVASSMLEWKGGCADGRLGRWMPEDLEEYLLGYFPRQVTIDEHALEDIPECAIALLRFLDARGSLSGAPIGILEDVCRESGPELAERARDDSSWGLAKSMAMQMLAEGVDFEQPGAMDAWIAEFNERPRAERDGVIGGAADRMLNAVGRPPSSDADGSAGAGRAARAEPRRRETRKAQRSARRKNRRR